MKTARIVATLAVLNAFVLSVTGSSLHAGQGNPGGNNRGGRAPTHMSNKGQENTNAQWSADPERGWVRADERHKLHEQSKSKTKQKPGKQKGSVSKSDNGKVTRY